MGDVVWGMIRRKAFNSESRWKTAVKETLQVVGDFSALLRTRICDFAHHGQGGLMVGG